MQLDPSAVSARVVEGDAIDIKIDTTPSGACNYNGEFFVTVTPSGDTATLADADAVEQRFGPCVSTRTVSFATEEDTDVTANRALSFTLATKAGTDSRITVVTDNVVEVAVIDDDGHATGAPAIAGTAQVGRKLTASPGTIADGDGLTGASYTYTWIRVDGATETEITGTTGNGYTPVAADQGKTLKVRASFTDDEGFDEQRDSAETATVATAPTTPTFGIADASADEGESITFTVTLNPAAGAAATVAWATSVATGDTAAQADFTAGNGTLNFAAGDTSKTFTVATVEDTASEPDETFTVTLSSASSGTALPSDATATGTIGDDDTRRVSIASGGDVASEGDRRHLHPDHVAGRAGGRVDGERHRGGGGAAHPGNRGTGLRPGRRRQRGDEDRDLRGRGDLGDAHGPDRGRRPVRAVVRRRQSAAGDAGRGHRLRGGGGVRHRRVTIDDAERRRGPARRVRGRRPR